MKSNSSKKKLPKNWDVILSRVKTYRNTHIAPCDQMGPDALSRRFQGEKKITPSIIQYRTLIALMLSSQTKDEIVSETILSLVADNGLSPASIAKVPEKRLNELIGKVGFHNRKASHIKQATDRILSEHHGDIPCDRDFVLSLPGVGPKMANLFMQCAYGVCEGVSVDVHMHRIFPLWGWVPKGLPTAEHTRQHLEGWLPREHWQEINPLVVGFGQTMCPALKPRCPE